MLILNKDILYSLQKCQFQLKKNFMLIPFSGLKTERGILLYINFQIIDLVAVLMYQNNIFPRSLDPFYMCVMCYKIINIPYIKRLLDCVLLDCTCVLFLVYWVTQNLPLIYTVIAHICTGKVAWFAVNICGNLWNNLYV